MSRFGFIILLLLAFLLSEPNPLHAFGDDGPPISITSPDTGTTFPHADIRDHKLIWNAKKKVLVACVTFSDARQDDGTSTDDTHYFALPGVTFDETKGIFTATSAKGEIIPVAHFKKMLFLKTIEPTPNANIRIMCPGGSITVVLEAVNPNDPAMSKPPVNSSPDSTQPVDMNKLFK